MHSADAGDLAHVRPQNFIFQVVRAFSGKIEIEVRQQRRECVGVKCLHAGAVGEANSQTI